MRHHHQHTRIARRAFTLIELMVVITIMGLLTTLMVVVYARSGENARIAGTKTLIRQLDSVLKERLEGFRSADLRARAAAEFPGDPIDLAIAKVRPEIYRQTFPQRVEDLYGRDRSPAGSDNAPLLGLLEQKWEAKSGNTPINTANDWNTVAPQVSSGELLFLVLTEGTSFGLPPLNLDGINAQYIADKDADGLTEFVDGWDQPLEFYNAPTALLRPNGNVLNSGERQDILPNDYALARVLVTTLPLPPSDADSDNDYDWNDYTSALNIDPFDPYGELGVTVVKNAGSNGEDLFESTYHSINTYYMPLIVSSGPDEGLGLYRANATTGTNQVDRLGKVDTGNVASLYDNLTNQQRGGF